MTLSVSDVRSNPNDQIMHAATVIGRSKDRREVFKAIYEGKKRIITVTEVEKKTNLTRKIISQEALKLSNNYIMKKTKKNTELSYEKEPFYLQNKKKILSLVSNKLKLENFPTKITPKLNLRITNTVEVKFPKNLVDTQQISIDDIDSFSLVNNVSDVEKNNNPLYERSFKEGIKRIIKENGKFTDWGGEKNDLFSTRVKIQGKRINTAFAFKGCGTKGKLTPKAMGKNGDQIQRLFNSSAELFLIQY
jgi:hypothetical protein